MSDDERRSERRKKRAAAARQRRARVRREREEALRGAAPATWSGVTPWPVLSRDCVEQHTAQLCAYLAELHGKPEVELETKIRLLAMSLPSLARAVESSAISKRLEAIEAEVGRRHGLRSVS